MVTVLVAAAVALTVLVLAGCAGDRAMTSRLTPGRGSPPAGAPSPLHVWVAVFGTAGDPNDLDAAAEDLMDRVGSAVVVASEGCLGGLRGEGDVRPGAYVLAVMAGSEDQLQKTVERAGEKPMITARVEDLCPE